ncbi:hypothetical protein ABAC460_05150 [Asticcacaulis sp. AC460]|uniref:hypothetical protein n=1 Tax=Asticcacaulis sp. AC460 TaxID=1282360 RepID=UPI0003C3FF39|nr:hypothetical protein [Asticcacaulis sp. AC460]ESQ91728.1 hypothetical protein ABAC460_05150 [Asticcacaulis sp. AC460]
MALSLDFAFEGFRTIRERPRLILLWGAVALTGHAVAVASLIHRAGPSIMQMQALQGSAPADAQRLEGVAAGLPGVALFFTVYLITGAILATAAARAALNPQDDRWGYLRFGLDEIRMFAVHALMVLMALFMLMFGGTLGYIGGETGIATGMFAAGGVILSLSIRLSLNGPQSLDRKVLDLFGSFTLTRPEVWRLILGYVIAFLLAFAVFFLCFQAIRSLVLVTFGNVPSPDYSSLRAYLTPPYMVVETLLGGVVVPLVSAIVYGAPAAAYRALKPSRSA